MPKKLTYQDCFDKGCELLSAKINSLAKELLDDLIFATTYMKFEVKNDTTLVELLVLLEKVLKVDDDE